MNNKSKQPLMRTSHLPLILLGATMVAYGLLTALVGSWFSSQAMRGLILAGAYRSQLAAFEQTAGLVAGILFAVLFIWCAISASGIVRVAFSIGAVASAAPVLAGRAAQLLFGVIGLPTMSAGSVLAGAVTTLFFALPMIILFILLASGPRVPRGCRWLSLASIFIVLGTAFFPIYVTVLAFLFRPGDPAVGRMIEISSQVIRLRFILPGLSFLFLSLISMRFERNRLAVSAKHLNRAVLTLVACALILSSCRGEVANTAAEGPATTSPATDAFAELNLIVPNRYDPPIEMSSVVTVDATVKFLDGNDIHNNVWTRAYEEMLGIKVTYKWVVDGSMYDQKLGLSINSGDIPDMFRASAAQLLLYHEAGLLADLTSVYEAEASAKTRDVLGQDPVALKAASIGGRLYGIPLTDASVATASVLWVRQDWMDKLGIAAPTSMQDVLDISRRFTEEDPDGNGVNDTIGLCVTKSLWGAIAGLQGFFNGYHAYPGIWFERDGGLVYGSVQPEMRTALLALQEMYAAGQIDREFGVKDINQVSESIAQSKCGMEFGVWWNPYHPLNLSQQNTPTAFWAAFPIPSADAAPAKSQYSTAIGSFLVVREGYQHPKALIRMVNFWSDNILGSQDDHLRETFLGDINNPDVVLYKYTPVVLWEPNATIDGGKKLREALAKRDPSILDLEAQWRYRIIQAYFEQGILEAWVEVATNGPNGSTSILAQIAEDRGMLNRFYGTPTAAMADKLPTLQTMEEVMVTKIIMGDSIDLFDQFVTEWYQLGGTTIVEEVNLWADNNP
jgi:putative aldouronate transport system substrate-binding protein